MPTYALHYIIELNLFQTLAFLGQIDLRWAPSPTDGVDGVPPPAGTLVGHVQSGSCIEFMLFFI
jgi:hypothetical protein